MEKNNINETMKALFDGMNGFNVFLIKQRHIIIMIVISLLTPGKGMRKDLNLSVI